MVYFNTKFSIWLNFGRTGNGTFYDHLEYLPQFGISYGRLA
jgi:hypothetical protein